MSIGDWYKLAIIEEGIYKIDASTISKLGINRKKIDPRNLAVYGNAWNGMLPQENAVVRPVDLTENACLAFGFEDGSFDKEDYLLFYGKPAYGLSFNAETNDFAYENNIYSDSAFYFLTIKEEAGLRMSTRESGQVTGVVQSDYLRFQKHEEELYNILETGRQWFGERVSALYSDVDITFDQEGFVPGSDIKLYVSVESQATVGSSFSFSMGGIDMGDVSLTPVSGDTYETWADVVADTLVLMDYSGSSLRLEAVYSLVEGTARGYLDYTHLVSRHTLDLSHGPLSFYAEESSIELVPVGEGIQVWDISDATTPIQQNVNSGASLNFSALTGAHLIAFNSSQILSPIRKGKVHNQSLRGMAAVDVLYITHPSFASQAERLATHRESFDGLSAGVVTTEQIYNEFSSGRQDLVAIRDFIRHQYTSYGQLKYVTLIGDGSYDYKNLTRATYTNFVPVYEAKNSVHRILSYSSDDFYGFMDEDEGLWLESTAGDHAMDLGIGRIPVKTLEEAKGYVNKVIRYETSEFAQGSWKNKVVFVADDGDSNIHQRDVEKLTTLLDTSSMELNVRKIFLDAYEQEGEPLDQTAPQASRAFVEALSKGTMLVNFVGHGREELLTHEQIFTEDMIADLGNRYKLPFVVTATCQFGTYDNPALESGGEQLLLEPQGGAIALLTSTRPVYASTNYDLNKAFYDAFVVKEDGMYRRLGDIMKETKNNSLKGSQNRNYTLLGDASMRLAFPKREVSLTTIDERALLEQDTLKALGQYTIAGRIEDAGELDAMFDGTVVVSLFDKPASFSTLGDESAAQTYEQQDVLLFQGEFGVSNGLFEGEIILPSNINLEYGQGKMTFYAYSIDSEASGYYDGLVIGDIADMVPEDNVPPSMSLYMDEPSFVSGDIVGANPLFLAHLFDQSGINTSKLEDQSILMKLDNEEEWIVNDYYVAAEDTFKEGWLAYPLSGLASGEHTITLVAYDTHGNRNENNLRFRVSDQEKIAISEVRNYPNPMQDMTTFRFEMDRQGEDLDISLTIINLQGQVVYKGSAEVLAASNQVDYIEWDGRDNSGNKVKKGIYIYNLVVKSQIDGAFARTSRKLVVMD